jgi:hypothetical protein
MVHAYKSLMPIVDCILSFTVWCNKVVLLLPIYWTASQAIDRMFIIELQFYDQQQRLLLANRMCLSDWLVSTPKETGTWCSCKIQGLQNCAWVNGFILQSLVFIWSFWLKNVISTNCFVIFKCGVNPSECYLLTYLHLNVYSTLDKFSFFFFLFSVLCLLIVIKSLLPNYNLWECFTPLSINRTHSKYFPLTQQTQDWSHVVAALLHWIVCNRLLVTCSADDNI